MTFLNQLVNSKIQLAETDTPRFGDELALAVYNGDYTPDMLAFWMETMANHRLIGSDTYQTTFEQIAALPQITVPTYRGRLSFGFDHPRKTNYQNLTGSIDEFLFENHNFGGSEPCFVYPTDKPARAKIGGYPNLVIRCDNTSVVFPYSRELQSSKEVSLTMLRTYREFLNMLKKFAKPGGLLTLQDSVELLSNGLVCWKEVGQQYLYANYPRNTASKEVPLYMGRDKFWLHGSNTSSIYRAVVAKTIVDNIINFELEVVAALINKYKDL